MVFVGSIHGGQTLSPAKIFSTHNLPVRHRHRRRPTPPIFISTNLSDVNPIHLRDLCNTCNHSFHRFPNILPDGRLEPVAVDKLRIALSHSSVVIPTLQGRGIGKMILQRIIRLLTNKGIYDIAALCSDQEMNFFKGCGFGDDILESTTMMYSRSGNDAVVSAGLTRTSSQRKLQWFDVGWCDPSNKYCTKVDASGNENPIWKTKLSTSVNSDSRFEDLALHVEVYSIDFVFLKKRLQRTASIVLKEKKNSNKPKGSVDVSIRALHESSDGSSSLDQVLQQLELKNSSSKMLLCVANQPRRRRRSSPCYCVETEEEKDEPEIISPNQTCVKRLSRKKVCELVRITTPMWFKGDLCRLWSNRTCVVQQGEEPAWCDNPCGKVIPTLQGRGIGKMILQNIIRLLTNKGIYDIAALCSDQEMNFFKGCGFGDDILESTTMMYSRSGNDAVIWVEICLIPAKGLTRTSSQRKLQWFDVGWCDPSNKYCTKVDASGNENPIWKTKLSTSVNSDSRFEDLALHVEVYSIDFVFLKKRLQRTASIVLKEFLDKQKKNSSEALNVDEFVSFPLRKKNSNKPKGSVDVSIRALHESSDGSSSLDQVLQQLELKNSSSKMLLCVANQPRRRRRSSPCYCVETEEEKDEPEIISPNQTCVKRLSRKKVCELVRITTPMWFKGDLCRLWSNRTCVVQQGEEPAWCDNPCGKVKKRS
ncbi:hypothetical protein E3N88_37309 [Mikania micrantha]|uniref:Glucosamine-phosphate N-acetyltransferase n=1 Tax=Mikania micrantha TaxID=192012 RepID=A0A5N6LSZ4_9ASTR|nr:hypothetical protein E3N88_37309 [Mikania micrantha]